MTLDYIGSEYGGKLIPEMERGFLCYSFGAGQDTTFDLGIAKKYNAKVFIFDLTPLSFEHFKKNDPHDKRLTFSPYGISYRNHNIKLYFTSKQVEDDFFIGKQGDRFLECKSLPTIMKSFGHTKVDLLKIDIEGSEYLVLAALMLQNIRPKVICVEFHYFYGKTRGKISKHSTLLLLRAFGYKTIAKKGFDYTLQK